MASIPRLYVFPDETVVVTRSTHHNAPETVGVVLDYYSPKAVDVDHRGPEAVDVGVVLDYHSPKAVDVDHRGPEAVDVGVVLDYHSPKAFDVDHRGPEAFDVDHGGRRRQRGSEKGVFSHNANEHSTLNSAPVAEIRPIDGRRSNCGRVPITGSHGTVGTVPGNINEICALRYPSTTVNIIM